MEVWKSESTKDREGRKEKTVYAVSSSVKAYVTCVAICTSASMPRMTLYRPDPPTLALDAFSKWAYITTFIMIAQVSILYVNFHSVLKHHFINFCLWLKIVSRSECRPQTRPASLTSQRSQTSLLTSFLLRLG